MLTLTPEASLSGGSCGWQGMVGCEGRGGRSKEAAAEGRWLKGGLPLKAGGERVYWRGGGGCCGLLRWGCNRWKGGARGLYWQHHVLPFEKTMRATSDRKYWH